ncbi:hypothetical protein [Bradyrhizobium erythrophlei]|uniref:hypothetical protein n=1 Tax=Bradyrhizobium erythrophlei TaxID=1437360 RepID=UPI00366DB530
MDIILIFYCMNAERRQAGRLRAGGAVAQICSAPTAIAVFSARKLFGFFAVSTRITC